MNCVFTALHFKRLGITRKVNNEDVGVQEEMVTVNKTILESPMLDRIASFDRATKAEIESLAVPGTKGFATLILPQGHIDRALDYLKARADERVNLVHDFIVDYERAKSEARIKLNGLYNPCDYPESDKVEAQFDMTWRFYSLDTPGILAEINPMLYEEERRRYMREWEATISEATTALADELRELMSHLIDRLTPGPDGKAKTFKQATIENLRDFLEKFQPRNIENHETLAKVANECQKIVSMLGSNSAELLRKSDNLREMISTGMDKVRNILDSDVTLAPTRHIRLMTDEEMRRCA
jgi:hypothetical protein